MCAAAAAFGVSVTRRCSGDMGHRWSGRRHNVTAVKEKAQTACWTDGTNASASSAAINSTNTSYSQAHANAPADDGNQLANAITIYRSYSSAAPPEAEVELRPRRSLLSGVRCSV